MKTVLRATGELTLLVGLAAGLACIVVGAFATISVLVTWGFPV